MSEETFEGLDAPEEQSTTEVTPDAPAATDAEPAKVHPAYEKLLAELPEAWHEKVKPHLQEQDRYFQQQLEKYSPYKQFLDDGVDASYISQSMQLAQAIAADPVTVHQNLTTMLMQQGLIRSQAEAQASQMMDDATDSEYEEEGLTPAMKRELEKRDAEMNQLKEQMGREQFEKATQIELQRLNQELDGLRSNYDISAKQEAAILELMDAAMARGQDMTVYQAAKKLVDMTGVGFAKKGAATGGSPAPTVLGGAGGAGVPFEAVEVPKDNKGKKEMLAQMFKNQLGG